MILTDADKQLLPLALRQNKGFHLATQWYIGWEPLWYQFAFHQTTKPNITFLAGIASGKTTSVAASYLIDCLTIPYFRALNTSVTAKQAELPFEMVQTWIEGNKKIEHMVEDISLRPYPTIKFVNGSEWVFRTAGQDARFIRGMEFDRINYDEAGLDFGGEAIKVLRGRLRGVRPNGLHRMGRLDVTTSPTDAPWLRERFERGDKDNPRSNLSDYLSLRISTYENTRLTRQQISLMEQEYTDDMIDVELRAMFPDYGMSTFPRSHIAACTDQSINDAVELALHPESGSVQKGYSVVEHPRYGITKFEMPYIPGHIYVLAGDPGTDGPPHRNSPGVICLDVTRQTETKLVYLDWVDGKGSYTPFLTSYKYAISKYHPVLKGIDSTGTQKAIDELAFENMGIEVEGINFQRDKEAMINTLSLAITEHSLRLPVIKGLDRQLSSYSRENDSKIPQDLVMTLAIATFLARFVPEEAPENSSQAYSSAIHNRRQRTANRRRRR